MAIEGDPHSLPMCRVMTAISVKGQKLLLWKSLLCPAAHLTLELQQRQKHRHKAHLHPSSLLGALDLGMTMHGHSGFTEKRGQG